MKHFSLLNLFLVFALLLGALPAQAQGKFFRGTFRVIIAGPACSETFPLNSPGLPRFDVYFSNSPELLNDSIYVAKALDWSSEPQLNNGKVVKSSSGFPGSGYYCNDENDDYGVWAYDFYTSISTLRLTEGDRLYYRFYSPQFINPIKGSVVLENSEATYHTVRIDDLLRCKSVKFTRPIDIDGKVINAYLAPNRNTAKSNWSKSVNMAEMSENSNPNGFILFAQPGTKIEYAIEPLSRPELAMRTGDYFVGNSEIQTIETDYRNAVKCRLYINDSKGKRCNVPHAQSIGSFYYESYPGTCTKGYGCLNRNIGEPKKFDNGTICMYAFSGKLGFQFYIPGVETDDPNFVIPYNTPTEYLMAKLYVAENVKEQDFVMGESKPFKVTTTLKNAAKFAGQVSPTFSALYLSPYSDNTNPTVYERVTTRVVESKVVGNDLVQTLLVNNAEGKATQKIDLRFKYSSTFSYNTIDSIATALACHGVNIDSHATELQLTEKNFAYDLNNKPIDFSKIAAVRFMVPCKYFKNADSLFVTNNKGLDIAIRHPEYSHKYRPNSSQAIVVDTIVCLLPDLEDSYAWFAKTKNASRPTNEAIIPIEFDNNRYAEIYPNLPGFSIKRMFDIDGVQLVFADNSLNEFVYKRECVLTEAPTCEGGIEEKQAYFVNNTYPIEEGKNDYEIKYRQLKFNTAKPDLIRCFPEHPDYYTSRLNYGACQNYYISTDSHLYFSVEEPSYVYYIYDIQPSENDFIFYPNLNKTFKVNFVYNGKPLPDGYFTKRDLNISYKYKDEEESPIVKCYLSDLLYEGVPLVSGQYTMSGEIGIEYKDSETNKFVTIDIPLNNFKFEVKDAPLTVELNPVANAIDNVNASPSNVTVVRRYTMDGRSISMPQRGVNLLQMSDGTIRKVIVK